MKRFREYALTPQQQKEYNDFKQNIKDEYDNITVRQIVRINRDLNYPCSVQQCQRIHFELKY